MNFENTNFTPRQLQLQWVNNIVQTHDLICNCNKPLEHAIYCIFKQEPDLRINKETKELIEKCLTTQDGGRDVDIVDEFGEEELNALFAEDTGDDTG